MKGVSTVGAEAERRQKIQEIRQELEAVAERLTERYGELFAGTVTVEYRAGPWPSTVRAGFTVSTGPGPTKEEMEKIGFPVSTHGLF
jgi:hypothetical protein